MRRLPLPARGSRRPAASPLRLALLLLLALPLPAARAQAWTPGGTLLSDAATWSLPPSYSGDDRGGAAAFWTSGSHAVWGSRLDAEGLSLGVWQPPGDWVVGSATPVDATVSAPDGTGGHYVVAYEPLLGVTGPKPFLVSRVQTDGTLAPGWTPGGLMRPLDDHARVSPRLFADGTGGMFLVWLDALAWELRDGDYGFSYAGVHEVRAMRLTGDGQTAAGWPDDGVRVTVAPPGAATSAMLALQAVADGGGGVFIAWTDSLDGYGDVHLQHLGASGVPASGWTATGRTVAAPAAYRELASLILDGAGGVLVSWGEYRDLHYQAFVQRFDGAGAVAAGWPADGRSLCPSSYWPFAGPLAADGTGGALVGVQDWRDGLQQDVFVLRVLGDGSLDPAWPAGGLPLSSSNQYDVFQGAVPDGLGGATFLWANQSTSGTPQDFLRATHLTSSGALASGWPAGGELVSSRIGHLYSQAALVPDGYGGAVAIWTLNETSAGVVRTYATRLPRGGLADVPAPVATLATESSLAIAPNPFAGAAQVSLALPRETRVTVEVFDPSGRRVRTLSAGALGAGPHAFPWDGRDESGASAPAGLYLVRARGDEVDITRRVIRLP
jgi:hypothetical protein